MNYRESLVWVEALGVFGSRLGLSRIRRLLQALGNPQDQFRTIHVTGTNGKGSVTAMLTEILQRSGLHTGCYTSPHLFSYTERVRVDGQDIPAADFAACLTKVRAAVDGIVADGHESPTQFEVLTALAFLYFAKREVRIAVIEVGLGGTLDSTNVITPEVSVITNVTFEHADRLGGTIESIAANKAGIIKEGVPVVTAASGIPLAIIRRTAAEKNADLFVFGEDFRAERVSSAEAAAAYARAGEEPPQGQMQHLSFTSHLMGIEPSLLDLHLLGSYQIQNAAVAVMTAEVLRHSGERIQEPAIREALRFVRWPARFEHMRVGGQDIVIDGAHNPDGARVLRESLDAEDTARERVYVLGILGDKDRRLMLGALLRPSDTVVVTPPQSERAGSLAELADLVRPLAARVECYADNDRALARGFELAGGEKRLILAGSLYLVGGLRQKLLARQKQEAKGGALG